MKKRRPKNRNPKVRDRKYRPPAEPQVDPVDQRLRALETLAAALAEAVGVEAVRRGNAAVGSKRARAQLGAYVATGRLSETREVGAQTVAVEISEHSAVGEVLTESLVAELHAIDAAQAKALSGAKVGDMVPFGVYQAQVRRCWDTVTP